MSTEQNSHFCALYSKVWELNGRSPVEAVLLYVADECWHLGEALGTFLHTGDARENAVCERSHAGRVFVEASQDGAINTLLQEHVVETADATFDCVVDILPQRQHLANNTNNIQLSKGCFKGALYGIEPSTRNSKIWPTHEEAAPSVPKNILLNLNQTRHAPLFFQFITDVSTTALFRITFKSNELKKSNNSYHAARLSCQLSQFCPSPTRYF